MDESYSIGIDTVYPTDCSLYVANERGESYEALIESVEWKCLGSILCNHDSITINDKNNSNFWVAKLVFQSLKDDYIMERNIP